LHDKIFLFFASWQVYNSIVSMVMSPFCQREGASTAENQGLSSAVRTYEGAINDFLSFETTLFVEIEPRKYTIIKYI
jgi:hypothetical protein